jgi:hypothetical protein
MPDIVLSGARQLKSKPRPVTESEAGDVRPLAPLTGGAKTSGGRNSEMGPEAAPREKATADPFTMHGISTGGQIRPPMGHLVSKNHPAISEN